MKFTMRKGRRLHCELNELLWDKLKSLTLRDLHLLQRHLREEESCMGWHEVSTRLPLLRMVLIQIRAVEEENRNRLRYPVTS